MQRLVLTALCALAACATQPLQAVEGDARPAGPETVFVMLGSDGDALARAECGGEARRETVHRETNVVTYRCLREAN